MTTPHQDKIFLGITSGITAFFLLALMGAGVKLLAPTHHVIEIAFYRNLIAIIPMLGFIAATGRTDILKTAKPKLLALRVTVGTTGLILTFAALAHLPMADATVIFFTSSLLAPALAFFFLKEQVGRHRWSAILIGMSGVLLVARPSGDITTIGLTLALSAATCHAFIHLFLRSLKTENAATVTFYFFAGGTLIPALFMPFIAQPPTAKEALTLLAVGVFGGTAQYFLTKAFQSAPVAIITPITYTGLLWATGLDILLWDYVPPLPVFAGGAIIIAANLYVLHRERLARK